jgi:N-acetyl-gamma-glutamyl-phosphate reductase
MSARVAVAGASGYAGGELLRLVVGHPDLELAAVCAASSAGEPVTAVHPHLSALADRVFEPTDPRLLEEADLVFLALPHGASAALVAQLPDGLPVVDLGADFRLTDPSAWVAYYGGTHAGTWTYGLPELPGQRERIAESTRVASTGCYAVAVTVALAPLVAAGVVCPEDVVVVAASGTTGAGRGLKTNLLASTSRRSSRRAARRPCP